MKPKHLSLIENQGGDSRSHLLSGKPIRITRVSDAKRLLSKLIYEFQRGTIQNQDAKDLCYLLISFVNVCTQVDFELRLKQLEEKFEEETNNDK